MMSVDLAGFYASRLLPVRSKDFDDAYLSDIIATWDTSRRSYRSPRVHIELELGQDVHCSHKHYELSTRRRPTRVPEIER